ncbi:MAG: response regulator transcription factor [Capnocytophaga sp.]|nr:response regulator transcription factor [Capnocytophaga sp.]
MKILIADDHSLIIDGFIAVIKNHDTSIDCYTATNKNELFDVLETKTITILFQDVMFGKNDARDFVKEIKEKYPLLKIIIISTLEDIPTVETLIKQGVDGYLVKSGNNSEIVDALTTVQQGRSYISESLTRRKHTAAFKKSSIILTPREKEVLSLILKENTTKEIADKVCLSQKTVESHRANLFVKFGVKNMAGLVKQAILEGFL